MITPFGLPFTNVAAAFDIFCFFGGATGGEDCFGSFSKMGVRKRSNEGGVGLSSDATGTMIACEVSERYWLDDVRPSMSETWFDHRRNEFNRRSGSPKQRDPFGKTMAENVIDRWNSIRQWVRPP